MLFSTNAVVCLIVQVNILVSETVYSTQVCQVTTLMAESRRTSIDQFLLLSIATVVHKPTDKLKLNVLFPCFIFICCITFLFSNMQSSFSSFFFLSYILSINKTTFEAVVFIDQLKKNFVILLMNHFLNSFVIAASIKICMLSNVYI